MASISLKPSSSLYETTTLSCFSSPEFLHLILLSFLARLKNGTLLQHINKLKIIIITTRKEMATPFPQHLLPASSSSHFHGSSKMTLRVGSPPVLGLKGPSQHFRAYSNNLNAKPKGVLRNASLSICCSINMAAGQSGDPERINLNHLMNKATKLWDSTPQPVKSFPWNTVLENFIQLILDIIISVVKFLSVPLLVVTSLSEMSYCAHQKKLLLVPFPLLMGMTVAGVLKETALELSPLLKDAEVPWHLITIAIFFTLIKLPGPYYPYWGRIFIPHFANGVLWRTLWFTLMWYSRPIKASSGTNDSHSDTSEV